LGYVTDEICSAQCPLGSEADIAISPPHVRFTPESGHRLNFGMSALCQKADILLAVLSVELIVQQHAHDVVGEMGASASVEVVIEAHPKEETFELDASRHSVADQP
jgi:hypothetical protein